MKPLRENAGVFVEIGRVPAGILDYAVASVDDYLNYENEFNGGYHSLQRHCLIILHEIYGLNRHIETTAGLLETAGYAVCCPNLLGRPAFDYDQADQAYAHFYRTVGLATAAEQARRLILAKSATYERVSLVGYSVGATVAWLCSALPLHLHRMVGFYGSRIRDYREIRPQCPTLLLLAQETSFPVAELAEALAGQANVRTEVFPARHGFADPFGKGYDPGAALRARELMMDFLGS